jgi:hypothetical protein
MEIVGRSISYYLSDPKSDFTEWKTNWEGDDWYNLMGMSWEAIDPPKRLVNFFQKEKHKYVFNS